jgi:hypothetical protein
MTKKISLLLFISLFSIPLLAGCSPEVGSKDWCNELNEKPKGDWTANEITDYAKNCIL